jgi:hypothetical protein
MSLCCRRYIKQAKERNAEIFVPPNTMFETSRQRNTVISWATAIIFGLSVAAALVVFGHRYSQSEIYDWNSSTPLAAGFWGSRWTAHEIGCPTHSCFAVSQHVKDHD